MKKQHHAPDYAKNRTADVIPRGNGKVIPMEQFEMNLNLTPEGNDTPWGAFLPRAGKNRPTTHVKINECDH